MAFHRGWGMHAGWHPRGHDWVIRAGAQQVAVQSHRRTANARRPRVLQCRAIAFDILQPAYAGLYSGAIHPTAEAHAIVADYVIRHARGVIDKPRQVQQAAQ